MNIKTLRELIKDLPDDMQVMVTYADLLNSNGESETISTTICNGYFCIDI